MSLVNVLELVASVIGVAIGLSSVVAVVLVAKTKGTIDALKEAVNSYQSVSEARAEEIIELKKEIVELKAEVLRLSQSLATAESAVGLAVKETLRVLDDYLTCPKCGHEIGGE